MNKWKIIGLVSFVNLTIFYYLVRYILLTENTIYGYKSAAVIKNINTNEDNYIENGKKETIKNGDIKNGNIESIENARRETMKKSGKEIVKNGRKETIDNGDIENGSRETMENVKTDLKAKVSKKNVKNDSISHMGSISPGINNVLNKQGLQVRDMVPNITTPSQTPKQTDFVKNRGHLFGLKQLQLANRYIPSDSSNIACKVGYKCHYTAGFQYNISTTRNIKIENIISEHGDISFGGSWFPQDCKPRPKVVIIFPYNNNEEHLIFTLNNLIPFLKLQKTWFSIFVVEQVGETLFNKGFLMNIGFIEASKRTDSKCFIFHDVDVVPTNLCNQYLCDDHPRQLVVNRKTDLQKNPENVAEPYDWGGMAIKKDIIQTINGFTNIMFGWGGELDALKLRLNKAKYNVLRDNPDIGTYYVVSDGVKKRKKVDDPRRRPDKVENGEIMDVDGLSSIANQLSYKITSVQKEALFTRIVVLLNETVYNTNDALKYYKRQYLKLSSHIN